MIYLNMFFYVIKYGNAHYNMQMKVIVETEEEYNSWLKEQSVNKIANL